MFLKSIRSIENTNKLDLDEEARIENYLADMKQGTADGEMDIEWQATGRGYYIHLHNLENISDDIVRDEYLRGLREDIDLWLIEDPDNYMVLNVKRMLDL